MKLFLMVSGVAVGLWCVSFASALSLVVGSSGASRLFARGANLCRLVSTAKMDAAVGVRFRRPVWGGTVCIWEAGGGQVKKTTVWLSVHRGLRKNGVISMVRDERHVKVTKVSLAGSSYAVVSASGSRGEVRDTVFAVYPKGAVFVTVTAPNLTVSTALSAARAAVS